MEKPHKLQMTNERGISWGIVVYPLREEGFYVVKTRGDKPLCSCNILFPCHSQRPPAAKLATLERSAMAYFVH